MMKDTFRTFKIKAPEMLESTYETCQALLDFILNDDIIRHQILNDVDYSVHKGKVLDQYTNLFGYLRYESIFDNMPSKAWYFRMVCENIRLVVESMRDRSVIREVLLEHDFKIEDIDWTEFKDKGIKYPTLGFVHNVKEQILNRHKIELPRHKTFVMDYSISEPKTNCIPIKDILNAYKLRIKDGTEHGSFISFEQYIPYSFSRHNLTGKLSKPRFQKDPNGVFYSTTSAEIERYPLDLSWNNILGVDLGKIHLYTAAVLYSDTGKIKKGLMPSRAIYNCERKLRRLYDTQKTLLNIQANAKGYIESEGAHEASVSKYKLRETEIYRVKRKINRLKDHIDRLGAYEIVKWALENECATIAIEDLSWLETKGGKWTYSQIGTYIKEAAELYSIKVEVVNCRHTSDTHPVTGQKGVKRGRLMVFKNGGLVEVQDRDQMAAVNIANRSKRQKHNAPKNIGHYDLTPQKFKNTKSHRQIVLKQKKYLADKLKQDKEADAQIAVSVPQSSVHSLSVGYVADDELNSLLAKGWKKRLSTQFNSFPTLCYRI